MYNLLVSAHEDAWEQSHHIFGPGRFLEGTEPDLKARFAELTEQNISELCSIPTLFAYETGVGKPARVGRIKTIDRRGAEVRVSFELDDGILPVDPEQIEKLVWELKINHYEMNRTHWTVKKADLINELKNAGLVVYDKSNQLSPKATFSRGTILAACDILAQLGHSGFDRFLLELGIAEIKAGRDKGGLASRSVALAEFVLADPLAVTAEGTAVADAVIQKAIELDAPKTTYPWSDDEPAPSSSLAKNLAREGLGIENGRIVSLTSPQNYSAAEIPSPSKPKSDASSKLEKSYMQSSDKAKVFLVHGRNDGAKYQVARYLEKLGLDVVILHERANKGRTLISKFSEESSDIEFAVVLMTPDDKGGLATEEATELRARQNVVLELGFFLGKLGPQKVCALVASGVARPSDFDGVVYISYGESTRWETELARELREAGIKFDPSKVF
jgi:predicted nucleotide-binding protein